MQEGAYAVTFSGNIPNFDINASNREQTRAVQIQVKTKRTKGVWHASSDHGRPRGKPKNEEIRFWVLVDLSKPLGELPDFYVIPEYWIQNDIHKNNMADLASVHPQTVNFGAKKFHKISTTLKRVVKIIFSLREDKN
jgi:hypothetical protein